MPGPHLFQDACRIPERNFAEGRRRRCRCMVLRRERLPRQQRVTLRVLEAASRDVASAWFQPGLSSSLTAIVTHRDTTGSIVVIPIHRTEPMARNHLPVGGDYKLQAAFGAALLGTALDTPTLPFNPKVTHACMSVQRPERHEHSTLTASTTAAGWLSLYSFGVASCAPLRASTRSAVADIPSTARCFAAARTSAGSASSMAHKDLPTCPGRSKHVTLPLKGPRGFELACF